MAEAELQKQQKYFVGFVHGLRRDFTYVSLFLAIFSFLATQ